MKIEDLKVGELYRLFFVDYGSVYYHNGKSVIDIEEIKKFQFKIVLLLEPRIMVDTDRGLTSVSKILVNNNIFYVRSEVLKEFDLSKYGTKRN